MIGRAFCFQYKAYDVAHDNDDDTAKVNLPDLPQSVIPHERPYKGKQERIPDEVSLMYGCLAGSHCVWFCELSIDPKRFIH